MARGARRGGVYAAGASFVACPTHFAGDASPDSGNPNVSRWTICGRSTDVVSSKVFDMNADRRPWAGAGLDPRAREALASGLPASEVWSFLLGVLEERARARTAAGLREQWRQDRFVRPCSV